LGGATDRSGTPFLAGAWPHASDFIAAEQIALEDLATDEEWPEAPEDDGQKLD
jgi:hypothetical protein